MLVINNVEVDLAPIFDKYHLGTTIWGPISGGTLSVKYNYGNTPEGSRVDVVKHPLI
jgi:hypothetical protein